MAPRRTALAASVTGLLLVFAQAGTAAGATSTSSAASTTSSATSSTTSTDTGDSFGWG